MEDRFASCSEAGKGVLRAIRRLYYAGIYREREVFSIERIKRVCKKEEIEKKQYEWTALFRELKSKAFIELLKNEVRAEQAYLEFAVEDGYSALDNLTDMKDIFSDDPEALVSAGNQAYHVGVIDIQKAKYMKVAIEAYEEVLKVYTFERFPMQYATTQNNLGNAYSTLAEVEEKPENCKKAIKAYEQALQVFTKEEFPEPHKLVKRNLIRTLSFCKDE